MVAIVFGGLVGLIVVVGIVALHIGVEAWVFQQLWQWFLAPLGLPEISFAQAAGISLTMGMLVWQYKPQMDKEGFKPLRQWAIMITVVYLTAWVVKGWM